MNHASKCGYLAALNKDLVQEAIEELACKNPGIVDRLNAKIGVVKKCTHEDLNGSSSQTGEGDAVPPLKCPKTEPLLTVKLDETRASGSRDTKLTICSGKNIAEMFQMEGKKVLKEKADQALVKFIICCGIPPHILQKGNSKIS